VNIKTILRIVSQIFVLRLMNILCDFYKAG
jgi:hypothetical protein